MSAAQRVQKVLAALGYIGAAVLMLWLGEDGYELVLLMLGLSLTAQGIRSIVFYFNMARHMVDGRSILYKGVILLDFGIFTSPSTSWGSTPSPASWTSCARSRPSVFRPAPGVSISRRGS